MKSSLCLCLGTNLCKSCKSPPVIFHNRPNVPVNVTVAEENCNYILSSTRQIFLQLSTLFLWLSTTFCPQQGKYFLNCQLYFCDCQLYFVHNKVCTSSTVNCICPIGKYISSLTRSNIFFKFCGFFLRQEFLEQSWHSQQTVQIFFLLSAWQVLFLLSTWRASFVTV